MANLVIVTDRCYLICQSISYIAVNENPEDRIISGSIFNTSKRRKKRIQKKEVDRDIYKITIQFVPVSSGVMNSNSYKSSGDDSGELSIRVEGKEKSLSLFRDIVAQIREQMPDELYLDKLVDKFLQTNKGIKND